MTQDEHRKAGLAAMLEAERYEVVLKATIELYRVATEHETTRTHTAAHATLDSLLDAKRAQFYHLTEVVRKAGEP